MTFGNYLISRLETFHDINEVLFPVSLLVTILLCAIKLVTINEYNMESLRDVVNRWMKITFTVFVVTILIKLFVPTAKQLEHFKCETQTVLQKIEYKKTFEKEFNE